MARILIVDDDAGLRSVLTRGLTAEGHEVLEAENGRRAMAQVRQSPPDLVITDINMPEMDGIEIINELDAIAPTVPVIAMSGGGRLPKELLLDTASALGAVEAIEKPFDFKTLLAVVERLLADSAG